MWLFEWLEFQKRAAKGRQSQLDKTRLAAPNLGMIENIIMGIYGL
jgi:hypothetical protein